MEKIQQVTKQSAPGYKISSPVTGSADRGDRRATGSQPGSNNELHVLLSQFSADLERNWSKRQGKHLSTGPDAVAFTVVKEAIAIGIAMTQGDDADSYRIPLRPMDHRYLENRSRALRSALHGVDDYIWWGGITSKSEL